MKYLITISAILAMLAGLLIMLIIYDYFISIHTIPMEGVIVLFTGAFLFVGGLLALAVFYRNRPAQSKVNPVSQP